MSAITQVPFYPSDWLAGTRGMTAAETGVYITIIAMIYERAEAIRCDDMAKLARLCGTSASALKAILTRLVDDGKLTMEGGLLSNKRAELEIKNVMAKSEVARDKANARWAKNDEKSMPVGCNSTAPAMQAISHKPIDNTPIVPSRGDKRPRKDRNKVSSPTYTPEFEIFWDCYPVVPNQSKAKASEAFYRLDKPDKATAIDGAMEFATRLQAEIERRPEAANFVPHAATWLNQRRWETLLEPDHRKRYEQQRPEVH